MNYIRLHIQVPEQYQEILIAELFDRDFDGFEQETDTLIASVPANLYDDVKREEIEQILFGIGQAELLQEELVAPQNWNEEWEGSIKPQVLDKFYIRPTWGVPVDTKSGLIEVLIDPKMAFGTGYHATTRLILDFLPDIIAKDDNVLDAGTGTGILGIAALKLGAHSVFGFDIDEWSKSNAEENIKLNSVSGFEVKLGSSDVIPFDAQYDVILANINRNALVQLLPELLDHLKPSGKIMLSGLLETDEEFMLIQPSLSKLIHLETRQEQEWIVLLFKS